MSGWELTKNVASTQQYLGVRASYIVHSTELNMLFTVLVVPLNSHRYNFKFNFPIIYYVHLVKNYMYYI